jgi:hypothetical protein
VSEPKEQLVQYQRRQKNIGAGVRAIAERLSAIVLEVQNNRLEPPGGRLQTRLGSEIVAPLRQVADDLVPRAAESLGVARQAAAGPARSTALADAIAHQTAALAQMKQILAHLVKSEGFQEAVNLLYEIQKAQTDVHEQTNKARQERIQRILEGAAPAGPAGGPGGGPAGLKK